MNAPDLTRVPLQPAPDVVARNIAGEHLLVPVRSGAAQMDYLFTADEVGSFIYALLDGRRTAPEIALLVTHEFDVTPERAQSDVVAFLETLLDARLVQAAEDAAP